MIRFSKSKINTYISCPEKYYLHYELRMRSEVASKTLVEGSAIHRLVEEGLAYGDTSPGHLEEVSRLFWHDHPFEQCAYDTEQAYIAAQDLCLWQSQQFLELLGPLQVTQIELEMRSDLIHPITGVIREDIKMLGFLDLIIIGEDDRPILVDLKTVGRTPREGMSRVALELSFYAYLYAQSRTEILFEQYPVALVYLIRTKDPKIQWDESIRSLPHFVELYEICIRIYENISEGCYWRNPGMHCSWCDMQNLCYSNEQGAISTFGQDQWDRYLLDQQNREESYVSIDRAVNF